MKICDDCFEDFEPRNKDQTVCDICLGVDQPDEEYTIDQCIHIWKVFHSRGGFDTQEQIDEYQKVKKVYKKLTRKDLAKVNEKIKKGKS